MQKGAVRVWGAWVARAAWVGLLDAIIWTWFRQVNYATPLLAGVGSADGRVQMFWLALVVGLGIVACGRDRLPVWLKAGGVAVAAVCSALAAWCATGAVAVTELLRLTVSVGLSIGCVVCQVARWERLSCCKDLAMLFAVLMVSLLLSYGLSYVLMVVPFGAYGVLLTLAPLSLLVRGVAERPRAGLREPLRLRAVTTPSALLCCCLGVAGGFIVAIGGSTLANVPSELLLRPSPLYFLLLLFFLALGVVAGDTLGLPRAPWFAVLGIAWSLGSMVGMLWGGRIQPGVAVAISTIICLVLLVCTFIGWSLRVSAWGSAPPSMESALARMACHGRLTQREIEVAALLIEGRSLPVVQERLSIAEGTARTHAKHIYEKCGVRSKQELIDLYWTVVRGEEKA